MKLAVIGCGYVADFYASNNASHHDLDIVGAYDSDPERRKAWCSHFGIPEYDSLEAAVSDPQVELVLNLTNPRSHFEVSSAVIQAGKHLYSEKPLGMTLDEAHQLMAMAAEKGVRIGTAPCNLLSEAIQETIKAVRGGAIGRVRLVYADYDDGMIAPHEKPWKWRSQSGAHWPAKDEFEIGCTYEHAGYYLTVLAALLGPAHSVTAFSSLQIEDKGYPVDVMAPDFSVGCIEYDDGVVARVTAGLVAPRSKSLTIVGVDGVIIEPYLRDDRSPILISNKGEWSASPRAWFTYRFRKVLRRLKLPQGEIGEYRVLVKPEGEEFAQAGRSKAVDFMRGPQDMADAIREGRPHRLSGELGVHVVEMIEVLQYAERFGHHRVIESRFPPIEPLL